MDTLEHFEMKDSGVKWLPFIPAHWDMMKISHMAILKSGESITSVEMESSGGYLVYGGNGVRGSFDDYTHEGDYVLIGRQGALCGNINYATGKFWASEHAIVVNPDREVNTHWLGETLRVMNLGQLSTAAAQPGISVEVVKQQKLPYPPLEEQHKISAYIKMKSAKIDKLVGMKRKVIAKLKEYRISLISEAVTQGIDENITKFDSKFDWLGDVPTHWEVTKFKYQVGFQEGPGIMAVDFRDEGVPLIRIKNVQSTFVDLKGCNFLDPEKVEKTWKHFRCQQGDLIISGSASTGLITEVDENSVNSIVYTGLIRLWPITSIKKDFIRWFVSSRFFFTQIDRFKTGATIQHFGPEHLRQMIICVPPENEQEEIAQYLELETKKIDNMVAINSKAIAKLEEYRSVLIASAITGKVDVSDTAIPEGL
ncbi:hypothetical protein BCV33_11250 [Vibrio lentus]|uniref:restriction endonuclease subunit S n=1 Tax=Vibrio lentus TaxID=136468 RepID=UPI000C8334D5|nr:restriction endonuclease subunit S [Vibrio lentus]MCC4856867.1 restriction endonuclease subunit S [Vibrio lentus]PME57320.1 hypothetical protein BCV33_11250 [Vibrio lentus]